MTIIVLDSSETVRTRIHELLLDLDSENLDVYLYSDAEEVLEFIRNEEVDLIFSSIETYGIDGISFVDILLRDNPHYTSKLFIVTSQTDNDSFEDIKGVGAKRFIKKPINEEYFRHFVIPEIDKMIR